MHQANDVYGINSLPAEYLMPFKYDLYNFGITKVKLDGSQETKGHKHFRIFLMSCSFLYSFLKITLLINNSNEDICIILGEGFLLFDSIRPHINGMCLAFGLSTFYIQFQNNYTAKSYSFLDLFKMLSGIKRPYEIGLMNNNDIIKLGKW